MEEPSRREEQNQQEGPGTQEGVPLCSRCGRCCREFEGQIRFKATEPLIQEQNQRESGDLESLQAYLEMLDHWRIPPAEKGNSPLRGEIYYLVPSKQRFWADFPALAPTFLAPGSHDSLDCLFLDYHPEGGSPELVPYCVIHGRHPQMCDAYPRSKGFVCKHHPERKYTETFLAYQRAKIGFAVEVLRQIYGAKVKQPEAFDLLTLLMDFGEFDTGELEAFFRIKFGISKGTWREMMQNLDILQLITIKGDPTAQNGQKLEGISLKEVEYLVDQIMKQKNWG